MAKSKKGLQDLADIKDEVPVDRILDQFLPDILEKVEPELEAAESALAQTEAEWQDWAAHVAVPVLVAKTLSHMALDSKSRYSKLLEELKRQQRRLDESEPVFKGVPLYKNPPGSKQRSGLDAVSAEIGKLKDAVAQGYAKVFGVTVDAAFDQKRTDDSLWNQFKKDKGE